MLIFIFILILRPRKLSAEDANRPEQLVPIRIEFDVEHHKMRDTFVWNLNGPFLSHSVLFSTHLTPNTDPIVTPEAFAQSLVEDYALAPSYHSLIAKSIHDQLSDFRAHSGFFDHEGVELSDVGGPDAAVIKGSLDESNAKWWALWRRRVKKESARAVADAVVLNNGSDAEDDEESYKKKSGSRKRAVNGEKRPKMIKTEQQQDGEDVSMLADNEFEADEEKKETKQVKKKTKKTFWSDLDAEVFKPLAVHEIKLDEEAMHEDMRILIKVCFVAPSFLPTAHLRRPVGHHCCLDQTRRPVRMGPGQSDGIARRVRRGLHARVGTWW